MEILPLTNTDKRSSGSKAEASQLIWSTIFTQTSWRNGNARHYTYGVYDCYHRIRELSQQEPTNLQWIFLTGKIWNQLPMSFLAALFALDITVFPHATDKLSYSPGWIFPMICMLSPITNWPVPCLYLTNRRCSRALSCNVYPSNLFCFPCRHRSIYLG